MKWTTTTASVAVAVLCMFVGAALSRTMHDPTTIGTVSDRSRVQPLMSVEAEERSNPSSSSVHGSQASQRTEPISLFHKGVRHSIPLREVQDIKFRPTDRVMRGSVATGTDTLIRACLAHEPATAGLFVSPSTVLVYRSMLPYGGIYKGYVGLLDLGYRAKLVFRKTAFEYSIPFVDEARGVSIVKMKFGGVFLRNQKNVESSATAIIHWHLGRISRIEIIEDDPKTLYEAFFTSAEAVVCKFYDTLFSGNIDDTASLLSDDIKSTTHMFPSAIGERLAYTGVDGFRKSATSKSGDWLLNRLQSIRVLYGDNSTVVAEASLGMQSEAMKAALMSGGRFGQFLSFNSLPGGSLDNESLKDMKVISIFKVNDGHKISSVTQMLTAPLMPWNLRTLGLSGVPGLPAVAAEASKAAVSGKHSDRPEQQGKQEKPASQQQQGKQDKPVEQPGKQATDKKSTDEKKP